MDSGSEPASMPNGTAQEVEWLARLDARLVQLRQERRLVQRTIAALGELGRLRQSRALRATRVVTIRKTS